MAAGISAALIAAWGNTLRNVPWVAPISALQLHIGDPGAIGTSNQSVVTQRLAVTLSVAGDGTVSISGALPVWVMTASEMISAISVWSGLDGDPDAVFLYSLLLRTPKQVANGDQYSQNSANLVFNTKAA